MPDKIQINWPANLGQRALEQAQSKIGEAERGGKNQGEIVEEVAGPFLSEHRLAEKLPTGILDWCAFFVSWAYLKACQTPEQEREWKRLASGQCSKLWERLENASWAWRWSPAAGSALRLPKPGAILFIAHPDSVSDSNPNGLVHVELVDHIDGDTLYSVGGNTGPRSDRVAQNQRSLSQPNPRTGRYVFGFAEAL